MSTHKNRHWTEDDARQVLARGEREGKSITALAHEQALRGRDAMRMRAARKRQDDPTLVLALLREVEPEDFPRGPSS